MHSSFYQTVRITILVIIAGISINVSHVVSADDNGINWQGRRDSICVTDNDLELCVAHSSAQNIQEFLKEQNIAVGDRDWIIPSINAPLFSATHIVIWRAKPVHITDRDKTQDSYVLGNTISDALQENGFQLGEDDLIVPHLETLLSRKKNSIVITRVEVKEETVTKAIDFEKKVEQDEKLSWRVKKVTQKGEKGAEEILYRVVYHNGKEITRKVIDRKRVKEPVKEVTTEGTYVKLGKAHSGRASWYAFTGTMSAANPWLPIGSYVKVTNEANGKSVIVRINDRGPFVPGRIIDLDKVAFQKIASLGAGVISVKMEEVAN